MPDQNSSGRSIDSRYIRRYSSIVLMRARLTNFGGGGKTRVSFSVDSIADWDSDMGAASKACASSSGPMVNRRGRIANGTRPVAPRAQAKRAGRVAAR
jgi:hypothetical protein